MLVVTLCVLIVSVLDLILLIFIEVVEILIILVVSLLSSLSLGLGPLLLILGVLHLLLRLLGDRPQSLTSSLGLGGVVGDHHVVEDGAGLDLPQIEANLAVLGVLADVLGVIRVVLTVVDLRVHPGALVVGVVNLPWLPLSLVLGVVDHGRLPLAVHLVVPVLGLRGVRVGDVLGFVPVLGLGILGVIELGLVNPVVGLLGLRVLDHPV